MKKSCRSLCKHAHQRVKRIVSSSEIDVYPTECPKSSGIPVSMAARLLWTSVPVGFNLTLNGVSSLGVGGHKNARGADFQRRCFSSKAPSRTHYYDVLGVSPKAKQAEIKSSYYRLSKIYHPDISKKPESKKKFTEISEAYEVLGNTKKRRLYDHGIYSRNEPPPDDGVDYTESFRQREGFGTERQAPPTGRTSQFNFDEFYRQHYGDAMNKKRAEQRYEKTYKEQLVQEEMDQRMRTLASGVFLVAICFTFLLASLQTSSVVKKPGSKTKT